MYKTPTNIQSIDAVEKLWKNTQEINTEIYNKFQREVMNTPYLLNHKMYVKKNKLGFGDIPFHYMWKILLDDTVNTFGSIRFMEIGVYKGQILSLIPLICMHEQYVCEFLGVTPLCKTTDKFSKYPDHDYESIIENMFHKFGINFDWNKNIIEGFSTDPDIIKQIKQHVFNLIYVDGSHNYIDVVSDIKIVNDVLKVGGYVIFDDASSFLNMPKKIFVGHADVGKAVRDMIEPNKSYKEIFACGHNRVFRRVCK